MLGAIVLRVGEEVLRASLRGGYLIIYGLILAGVILFMPRGLMGVYQSLTRRRALNPRGGSGSGHAPNPSGESGSGGAVSRSEP